MLLFRWKPHDPPPIIRIELDDIRSVSYPPSNSFPQLIRSVRRIAPRGEGCTADVILGAGFVCGCGGDDFGSAEDPGTGDERAVDAVSDVGVGFLHRFGA